MHLIGDVVEQLQPIARKHIAERDQSGVAVLLEGIVFRKRRHLFVRTEECEDQSVAFEHRIRALRDRLPQPGALVALSRHLEDGAVNIVMKAVVTAADPALLDDAELERCAAVAAMAMKQPNLSSLCRERRPGPRSVCARARGRSDSCAVRQTGCQKRRMYSPSGVPGPAWVISASSGGTSRLYSR